MKLNDWRKAQGLSLDELCNRLNKPKGTVLSWVYSKRKPKIPDMREITILTDGAVTILDFHPVEGINT